tara:strand:- start:139 stop:312 length:174 start_codon:yes stop_codon:yes gene_type:complete
MQYLYFGLFLALLAVIYIAAKAKSIEMAMLAGAFFLILIPSAVWGLMKEDEEREKHK